MIFLFFIFLFIASYLVFGGEPSGRNQSRLWHDMNGKWRVIYPDGKRSQRFTRVVADDYQQIFGGKVVPADEA